jgi:hypothetical protein
VSGDYEGLDRSDLVEDIRENREVSGGLYGLCRRVGYDAGLRGVREVRGRP